MKYFKNRLRGLALPIISDFKLFNENYTYALNLLKECFGNLQQRTHMNKLLEIYSDHDKMSFHY